MKESPTEREALTNLLVDSKTYLTRLAEAAKGVIGIDKDSGATVYLVDTSIFTDEQRVFLVLLSHYFSNRLGKSDSDSCTPSEIVAESGLSEKTVSKRLSDLERARIAESRSRGSHSIVPAKAEKTLAQIRDKAR